MIIIFLQSHPHCTYYISFFRIPILIFDLQEGTWKWLNGDSMSYTNWKNSNDIKNKDEDCAYMYSSSKLLTANIFESGPMPTP